MLRSGNEFWGKIPDSWDKNLSLVKMPLAVDNSCRLIIGSLVEKLEHKRRKKTKKKERKKK